MSPASHGTLKPGTRIATYEVESVLGTGGFGITYKGRDPELNCAVAIKEYLPTQLAVRAEDGVSVVARTSEDRAAFEQGLKRFLDEGRTLARFNEPSIVRVRRFLEDHGTAYLVMDYEEGAALAQVLQAGAVYTEGDLLRLVTPLLEGLAALHGVGVLHRDIKPGNIFLRRKGGAVLLDFGSAREMLAQQARVLTGMVTPGYAPIEQYSGHSPQGPWTDLYALGATIYHCLTGESPAGAPERVAALQARAPDPLADLASNARSPCSPDFIALVEWMLAPMPGDRPQTVAAVLTRLNGLSGNTSAFAEAGANLDKTVAISETPTRPPLTSEEVAVLRAQETRARAGEAEAQYKLGLMYANGMGAEKNTAEAVHWLRAAAEQNHLGAQVRLGLLLARTRLPDTSPEQACEWLRKAADHRDARAMFNLGLMHAHGLGIPRDITAAQHWYRRAAALGHSGAITNLRLIHAHHGWRRWFGG